MLRPATADDVARLTDIAFLAKRTWSYPESFFEIWKDELTITETYIGKHHVICEIIDGRLAGFYSIVQSDGEVRIGELRVENGHFLDHMFIDPPDQGRGIGSGFFRSIDSFMETNDVEIIRIFVDPHARGFYEKMGAAFLCDIPSSIPGRSIPVYDYRVNASAADRHAPTD